MAGRGGRGIEPRAEQTGISGFRKVVALKRLHPHLTTDSDLVKAFVHEATLASNLRHANCAQTYDLGKVDDTYFIAMEYVPGATVSQIIKQCNAAAGLIPIPIALNILMQILDGLDHAHTRCDDTTGKPLGIVHRDVSPSNIIVSNLGEVKLIDFGIAKAENTGHRTQTGLIKGKFGYVAPEYTLGQLDSRCDLFAVGVIAHEMLTGRRLFDGTDNFNTIQLLREAPIQQPSRYRPEVSRDFDDIVMTALQRDPTARWQSAAAMRTALGNYAHESKLEVTNTQVFEWVEWAFLQESKPESTQLGRALATLAEPSTGTKELSISQFDELDDVAKTIIRPSAMYSAQAPPEDIIRAGPDEPTVAAKRQAYPTKKIKTARTGFWIVLFLVVLAAAGAYIAMEVYDYELDLSVFG